MYGTLHFCNDETYIRFVEIGKVINILLDNGFKIIKAGSGLRTKGYFKFSYKLMEDGLWYMCDLDGNPVKPAPEDVQVNIKDYL